MRRTFTVRFFGKAGTDLTAQPLTPAPLDLEIHNPYVFDPVLPNVPPQAAVPTAAAETGQNSLAREAKTRNAQTLLGKGVPRSKSTPILKPASLELKYR